LQLSCSGSDLPSDGGHVTECAAKPLCWKGLSQIHDEIDNCLFLKAKTLQAFIVIAITKECFANATVAWQTPLQWP